MKGLVLGAALAIGATAASGQEILRGHESSQIGEYSPEIALILHTVNRGCDGIIDVHSRIIRYTTTSGIDNRTYREVLGADINHEELQNAVSGVPVEEKGSLEICIEGIEQQMKNLDQHSYGYLELQDILQIIKQPIEDPDGYYRFILERKIQDLEDRLSRAEESIEKRVTNGFALLGIMSLSLLLCGLYVLYELIYGLPRREAIINLVKVLESQILQKQENKECIKNIQEVLENFKKVFKS